MGVETALMAVSMGTQLAGAGMSIAQAAKQNQLAKQAAADAEKAMAEAKKELEKNYYASIGIAKEPYALQRQALLSQGAQAIAAGAESQRGAAATAGRVLMAQNAAQQGVTSNMSQDLYSLNKLVAGEDARLAGKRSEIDLAQVKGAQLARHAAIVARNQAIASAVGGVSGAAKTGLDAYSKFYVNDKTTPTQTTAPAQVTSTAARTPQYVTMDNAGDAQKVLDDQAAISQNLATQFPDLRIDVGAGEMMNPQQNGSILAASGMSSSSPFMPANNPLGMPASYQIPQMVAAPSTTLDLQQIYENIINNGGSKQEAIQAIKDTISQSENSSESDGNFMPAYNPLGESSSYTIPPYVAAPAYTTPSLGYQYPFGY